MQPLLKYTSNTIIPALQTDWLDAGGRAMPGAVAENTQIKEGASTMQLSSYLPNQGFNRCGILINQLHLRILPQSFYVQQLTQACPIQVKSLLKRIDSYIGYPVRQRLRLSDLEQITVIWSFTFSQDTAPIHHLHKILLLNI